MPFNISSGFLNTVNSSPLKMAPKLANIPKIVIFNHIDVNERDISDTYQGLWERCLKGGVITCGRRHPCFLINN